MTQPNSPETQYHVTAGDAAKRSLLVGTYLAAGWLGYAIADKVEPVTGIPAQLAANTVMNDDVEQDEAALGCMAAESGVQVDFASAERCIDLAGTALGREHDDVAATPRDELFGDLQTQLARDRADHDRTKDGVEDVLPLLAGAGTAYYTRGKLKNADKKRVRFIEHGHVLEADQEVREVILAGKKLIADGEDEATVVRDVQGAINDIRDEQKAGKEARNAARKARPKSLVLALLRQEAGVLKQRHQSKVEHRPPGPGEFLTPDSLPEPTTSPLSVLFADARETGTEYRQRREDAKRREELRRLRDRQDSIDEQNRQDAYVLKQVGYDVEEQGTQDAALHD